MDFSEVRHQIVHNYVGLARSSSRVLEDGFKRQINDNYGIDQFWPELLLEIMPYYEQGAFLGELANPGEVT